MKPNYFNRRQLPTDRAIARGAVVNILGAAGKALFPIYFVVITRLFGPEMMGLFYLVFVMTDTALTLAVSGLNDGMVLFVSRFADDENSEKQLYGVLNNGFVFSFLLCVAMIFFAHVGGPGLFLARYPQPGLLDAVQLLVWSLPFNAVTVLVISATKALIMMKWDALVLGFIKPLLLILFSLAFYFFKSDLNGLLMGYLLTNISLAVLSLFIFGRYFSYRLLFRHLRDFRVDMPLIKFAFPQSLNMTFSTFITNLDVMMLGYFNVSIELIGFYGMGAQIVRNLRQIKLSFSGAFAPIITRLHAKRDIATMNLTFSKVSRWTATLSFPLAALMVVFRSDVIRIFHESYSNDTTFMILLLVPPLFSCTVGLAGNIIVMTGYSTWNLINSIAVAALNGVLNYLLIPGYGLMGAAASSMISSAIVSFMQLAEAYFLLGTKLIIKEIYKPYVAALPMVALLIAAGAFGEIGLINRIVAGAGCLATFGLMMKILKMPMKPDLSAGK